MDDSVGWPPVQERQELSPQVIRGMEATVSRQIGLPEPVQGAWDMPCDGVERFLRS